MILFALGKKIVKYWLSHDMSIHSYGSTMIQAKKISLIDDRTSWIEVSWEKNQEHSLVNILQKNVIVS